GFAGGGRGGERHATADCARVYPGTVAETGVDRKAFLVPRCRGGSDDPPGDAALSGAPHERARALGTTRSHAPRDRARYGRRCDPRRGGLGKTEHETPLPAAGVWRGPAAL